MRVLMLGWEFPPFVSGGLGTACHGLTHALNARGQEVLFILPRAVPIAETGHVRILGSGEFEQPAVRVRQVVRDVPTEAMVNESQAQAEAYQLAELPHVVFRPVHSGLDNPYVRPAKVNGVGELRQSLQTTARVARATDPLLPRSIETQYAGNLNARCREYAERCEYIAGRERFDVIHAHDWMTWPAAQRIAAGLNRPWIAHVHSTEYDRGLDHPDPEILAIEQAGLESADYVLCVSHLTRNTVVHRYGVDRERAIVCYNGVSAQQRMPAAGRIAGSDRIVLFLGRMTEQKGPKTFLHMAKRICDLVENVKFVLAGAGDMNEEVVQLAEDLGIGDRVIFTGFLRGSDVDQVFRMADVYVMPSIREPFGIAPLEAIRHDVPVILSRNSGVSEVLKHALKVDFDDVEDIANKVIAVLQHPPLADSLRQHAAMEVRKLTWDGAAEICIGLYQRAAREYAAPDMRTRIGQMPQSVDAAPKRA